MLKNVSQKIIVELDLCGEFCRNSFATLNVTASNFFNGVEEIFLCLLDGVACADERAVFAIGVISDISAFGLFFNSYFHI